MNHESRKTPGEPAAQRTDATGVVEAPRAGAVVHHNVNVNVNHNGPGALAPWGPSHLAVAPPAGAEGALESQIGKAFEGMGPMRVAGLASVSAGMMLAAASTVAVLVVGAPALVLAALVPAVLMMAAGSAMALRKGGSGGGAMVPEAEVLEAVQRRGGALSVAMLALDTRRPLADCQRTLDAMAASGWVTVDVDDEGHLCYRVPALGAPSGARR